MFKKPNLKRHGLVLLQALLIVAVLFGSCVSLCDPACRERTQELACDGICVGAIIAAIRLLIVFGRRWDHTLFSWWCVARVLFGVELRYGLVGGYMLGIARALFACL